jgi:hypothetical protein
MGDTNKPTPGDPNFDWANPGPARPGAGIFGRQQHRAKGSFINVIRGSLLSERQQEVYYYVIFVATFSVAWFIDRPGQQSFFLANRVERHFLAPSFRPDLVSYTHTHHIQSHTRALCLSFCLHPSLPPSIYISYSGALSGCRISSSLLSYGTYIHTYILIRL